MMRRMSAIVTLPIEHWAQPSSETLRDTAARALEAGQVLYLPALSFALTPAERPLLRPSCLDPRRKNISFESSSGAVKGARTAAAEIPLLQALLRRFQRQALTLVQDLLPAYTPHLRLARTSYRPAAVSQRRQSPRKDDRLLHVDAFPSRPNHGERILRVFSNVNPEGLARTWHVGEPFEDCARAFLPRLPAPRPAWARLLRAAGITRGLRSAYDHYMLTLHDTMKQDRHYQESAPRETVAFAAGSTWIVFSDQTLHAALSGQYLLEQTLHLPVRALLRPEHAPLAVLERLTGRVLV